MQITDINVECGEITIKLSKTVTVQSGGENHFEDTVTFKEPGMPHCDDFFAVCEIPSSAELENQRKMISSFGGDFIRENEEKLKEEEATKKQDKEDEGLTPKSLMEEVDNTQQIVKTSGRASLFVKRFIKLLKIDPGVGTISGMKFKGGMLETLPLNEVLEVACLYYLFFGAQRNSKAASKTESNTQSISAAEVKVV